MAKTSSKTTEMKVGKYQISTGEEFQSDPQDGGWAWIVLFATFIAGLNATAAMTIFAVLLNDLAPLLSTTTTTLSWTPSVDVSTGLILGPMCAAIINKFGCRKATILAGILIFSGLTMSYFVTRVEFLILTYGVTVGMGTGICYVVFPVVLSRYFKKYFGVALGCLVASYASSRLIMAPLAQIILDEYGCRATMLLMGAVTLHICVAGCLYRQPEKRKYIAMTVNKEADRIHFEMKPEEAIHSAMDNVNIEEKETKNTLLESRNDQLTESVYSNTNLNSDFQKQTFNCDGLAVTEYMERRNSEGLNKNSCLPSLCTNLTCKSIDHTLLKEPLFYIISFSEVIIVAIMTYSNVFLFPLGIEIGLPAMKTVSVVSAKAAVDIFARLAGPSLITLTKIPLRCSFIVLNLIHAIILAVYVMAETYEIYISMSILSGLIFGVVVGLKNVLIADSMGVERLSSVIGLSAFLQGFLLLPIAHTMGMIKDYTGSFKEIFLFMSGLEVVVVILWSLKPFILPK